MKGITQRVYDRYRTISGLGTRAVKLISDDEVREIIGSSIGTLATATAGAASSIWRTLTQQYVGIG